MENENIQRPQEFQSAPSMQPDSTGFSAPVPVIRPFDAVFAGISVLLGFLVMRYAFCSFDGMFTTITTLLIFAVSVIYVKKCGLSPALPQWIMGIVLCAFSLVYSITASELIHGLCFIFVTALQFWWVEAVCIKARFVTRFFPFDLLRTVFIQPFMDFGGAGRAVSSAMKNSEKAKNVKYIIAGLAAALPLTFIVAGLLTEADEGISRLMNDMADSFFSQNVFSTVIQVIFAFPLGMMIFAMLRSDAIQKLYPLPYDVYYHERLDRLKKIPNAAVYAGVTPICLLYLLYVISQSNYFLSAFSGKVPENMLYSEYARRGFFELCAVAVINLGVILFMLSFSKKSGKESTPVLKIYAVIISGFTLFIIATAFAKMVLYISRYGLTRLRLYTSWFMVLLAVVFIVLAIRIFARKFPTAKILTVSFIIMFGMLCFSKPDKVIADYNVWHYVNGELEELDVDMLSDLSADGCVAALSIARNDLNPGKFPEKCAEIEKMCKQKASEYRSDDLAHYNLSVRELLTMTEE